MTHQRDTRTDDIGNRRDKRTDDRGNRWDTMTEGTEGTPGQKEIGQAEDTTEKETPMELGKSEVDTTLC